MYLSTLITIVFLVMAAPAQSTWVVRPDGVGPVKIGMTLSQLNGALRARFSTPKDKEDQGCFYVNPKSHAQLAFMIEDGRLVRIDVDKPGISTAQGIHVGDTEASVKRVYGASVKVEPSQYSGEEGGRYLTVISANGRYGTRFETEKGKVTTFYAGTLTAIQYVEGCE